MKSGFAGPSKWGCCGVTAVATCAEVPFGTVLEHIRHRWNHPENWRGSTNPFELEEALTYFGVKFEKTTYSSHKANYACPYLWEWAMTKAKPGVTYLLHIPGHVITFKDHFFIDQTHPNGAYFPHHTKIGNAAVLSFIEIKSIPSEAERAITEQKQMNQLEELF